MPPPPPPAPPPKRSQAVLAPLPPPASASPASPTPVPVTLAVMSRCPDAHFCEAVFDDVLPRVESDHLALGLTYIASPDPDAMYGVQCMHGDAECRGNIHQLCVAQALDLSVVGTPVANRALLDFVLCSNADKESIGQDAAAEKCWLHVQHHHASLPTWQGIETCIADPKQGQVLLLESVTNTAHLNVRSSCTVLIDHVSPSCVRDGGMWRDCPPGVGTEPNDFSKQIELAWHHQNRFVSPYAAARPSGGATPTVYLLKRQGSQAPVAPVGSTTPASSDSSASARPTGGDGHGGGGGGTNPSIFTFVIAIALFAIVVAFIVLRLIYRRRTGRSFFGSGVRRSAARTSPPGGAGVGTAGRTTGTGAAADPTEMAPRSAIVTVDDPLKPPKLWDAKVADFETLATLGYAYPNTSGDEKEAGKHAWDRIMPVAAALSPQLYPILFADQEEKDNAKSSSATTPGTGDVRQRIKSLRRHGSDAPSGTGAGGIPGSQEHDDEASSDNELTPATVNVTVLIAMPNASTVVPSNPNTKAAQGSRVQLLQAEAGIAPDPTGSKLARHASVKSMRSTRSFRSARTSASAHSVASARRSAFFGTDYDPNLDPSVDKDEKNKNKMHVGLVDTPTGRLSDAGSSSEDDNEGEDDLDDDDEDPEMDGVLPELMFGTASVPIYTLHSATKAKQPPSRSGSGLYTGGFTYSARSPPTRNDLHALLARAQDIRENKPVPPMNIAPRNRSTPNQPAATLAPPESGTMPSRAPSARSAAMGPARSMLGSVHSHTNPWATTSPPLATSPPPMGLTSNTSSVPLHPPASPARPLPVRHGSSGTPSPVPPSAVSTLSVSPNPWSANSPSPSPVAPSPLGSGLLQRSAPGAPASDLRVVEEEPPTPTAGHVASLPLARPTPTQAQPRPDMDLGWLGSLRD